MRAFSTLVAVVFLGLPAAAHAKPARHAKVPAAEPDEDDAPPPPRFHRRRGVIAGGVLLGLAGGGIVASGASLVIASRHAQTCALDDPTCTDYPYRPDHAMRGAGTALMIGGVALAAAAMPLIAVGLRPVADRPAPTVRVGLGALELGWVF